MILCPDLPDIIMYAGSDAERRVARLLKSIDGGDGAVAFHSVKLRSHPHKQQSEADFVVLWRGVVVVIEVKGGGVRKHDGIWYSVDRRNDWHRLSESPMDQARNAMYALSDIFREERVGWFARQAVVITPDIDAPPRSVEWGNANWFAKEDMTIAGLQLSLDLVVASSGAPPHGQNVASEVVLRERLFGEFTRMPVIDAQRGAVIEEQNRATADQIRVLSSLSRNQRMLVLGGAGTGKSLLLAESAKQEAESAHSVLITFRSPALVGFFSSLLADRPIDITPFDELTSDRKYDVVLIDEAQDLMTADAMDLLDAVLVGGRSGGRWRMFLDPNNQAQVDGRFDHDVYELVAEEAPSFDLNRNVRNTKAIVHVVQEYLGADVGDPGIVNGERIGWNWFEVKAGVDEAVGIAQRLVEGGARRSEIWIISVVSTDAPRMDRDGFTVTSPKFAKGLEAEHVIVCDLPDSYGDVEIAAFYVAVTRARVSLNIAATKRDKKRLQDLAKQQNELK